MALKQKNLIHDSCRLCFLLKIYMYIYFFYVGIERFDGKYFHSWEYCNADGLQGKKVVVIGIGNSGGDIAVDISRVAEKVNE